ncbi:MAG: PIN domain-containing protein [Candidatus Bilamarchaeaceae archaeon]
MTKALVDTNIIVYALHKHEKKHTVCASIMNQLIDQDALIVSIQNLVELSRVLSEKSFPSIDKNTISRHVSDIAETATVVYYGPQTIKNALSVSGQYGVHFFDALLAATMQENGIDEILTEDVNEFSKIPWIKTKNPLGKA